MSTTISATFKTRAAAEHALQSLETAGVNEKQVSMLVTDETRGQSFNVETHTKAAEGTAAGAATGGLVMAVLGGLATAGALAIPGLNIVVSGALIGTLAGMGAGATAGGLIGGLIGAGIPEHEATIYEDEIKNGSVLIAVKAASDDQEKLIKDILKKEDAHNMRAA